MTQAQRLTTANGLLEEVQLYVYQPERVTDFGLRKLDREADKLAAVDAATAYTIKAAISALRWDIESVNHWTNVALRLEKSYQSLINAAINMRLIGDVSASADLALEAFQQSSSDADAADMVCRALMLDARFEEAFEISHSFKNSKDSLLKTSNEAGRAIADLARLQIAQDDVRRHVEAGALVAAERHVQIKAIENFASDDVEDGERFVVSIHFSGDISKEIELDEAIVEKFLDDPEWDPMRLSLEFKYLTPDELLSE
jgi:hypothetical protein